MYNFRKYIINVNIYQYEYKKNLEHIFSNHLIIVIVFEKKEMY